MPLTTSQKFNEIKRSLHKHLEDNLPGIEINFDDEKFTPAGNDPFLVIRYPGSHHEPSGIGDVITGDQAGLRGRWHRVDCSLTIYSREDSQKASAGDLFDTVSDLLKAGDITLYDFTDPENPINIGKIYIDQGAGHTGPSPVEGRSFDNIVKRDLEKAGFSWISLNVQLSVLEEY